MKWLSRIIIFFHHLSFQKEKEVSSWFVSDLRGMESLEELVANP